MKKKSSGDRAKSNEMGYKEVQLVITYVSKKNSLPCTHLILYITAHYSRKNGLAKKECIYIQNK